MFQIGRWYSPQRASARPLWLALISMWGLVFASLTTGIAYLLFQELGHPLKAEVCIEVFAVLWTGAVAILGSAYPLSSREIKSDSGGPLPCLEIQSSEDLSKLADGDFLENGFRRF